MKCEWCGTKWHVPPLHGDDCLYHPGQSTQCPLGTMVLSEAQIKGINAIVNTLRNDHQTLKTTIASLLQENAILRNALESVRPGNPENGELR